ncbi:glycoside hydrolase family 2 TIM barrel-domain containing protein [Gracilinema caldarium]|uniref:glycoside hydrolase family 2 TIM barrel-domain containing protein n=1 Tax=Gracilinema caldarium TaxID=215591 RepID=UPI0026F251FA|nr:glycoside hydrolase family 2 TIM barrel-domain containing protein [Gracilinema caldarium]
MKKGYITAIVLGLFTVLSAQAQYVQTVKDSDGWRLVIDNKPVEIKGMVWAYTPIGQNYAYDLWSQPEEYIQRVIDTDMSMMKAMGVNVIRVFSMVPPKWVEYIYIKYGIYTVINDLFGRYGVSVNGRWYPNTDYSDKHTRDTLIAQAKKTAQTYKTTRGVLMYLLGNESNYGLVWSGSNIENLPMGEQNAVKAGYLYSLFEEAMAAVKDIDPLRPVGIINGDAQYIDLIKELCPSLDVLGINVYRGYKAFDSFYENIAKTLDKPIMFTEAGADAFNAVTKQEDQFSQMVYYKSQWKEIYEQAYGKGRYGNIIGSFVFEWIDEWWKHYQTKDLSVHNTTGTWANAGYDRDFKPGINNMDEEWFGVCALSPITQDGVNMRIPRAAYYLMQDIWKLSLYDSTDEEVQAHFASLNDGLYLAKGLETGLKQQDKEQELLSLSALDVTVGSLAQLNHDTIKTMVDNGTSVKQAFNFTTYAESNIGFKLSPAENLTGNVYIRTWTSAEPSKLYEPYPMYTGKNIDLYAANFTYDTDNFTLNGYYHVGHASFENTGDIFNINKEAFDIIGYDTYGSKAPIALEFVGKNTLEGLQIIGGPEVYGSAKPQILANYYKTFPSMSVFMPEMELGLVYAEEFGPADSATTYPFNTYGPGRKASLYWSAKLYPFVTTKLGALYAGDEKFGATYRSANGTAKTIGYLDLLGGSAELGTDIFRYTYLFGRYIYRGLVADTNPAMVRGSFFTGDSGSGNRQEIQVGADIFYGDFAFRPVARARVPLEGPADRALTTKYNNFYPPFYVFANRQSVEFEAVLTYDPEGATWFHEWNSDDIEGARFAASLTGLYILYAGPTDVQVFKMANGQWAAFSGGLPEQRNLWATGFRLVTNPVGDLRIIAAGEIGHQGSTGQDTRIVDYWGGSLKVRYGQFMASGAYYRDKWLEPEWTRTFNLTYPARWNVDLSYAFETPSFVFRTNRAGVKWAGWTFGPYSSDPWNAIPGSADDGKSYSELTLYWNISL